jgi:copper chaperone
MARSFQVPDISCDHGTRAIESARGLLDGVHRVSVALDAKVVEVEGTASDEAITAALVEAGYTPRGS